MIATAWHIRLSTKQSSDFGAVGAWLIRVIRTRLHFRVPLSKRHQTLASWDADPNQVSMVEENVTLNDDWHY